MYWENGNEQDFFEIEDLSMPRGIAKRVGRKKGFKFTDKGVVELPFINIVQD